MRRWQQFGPYVLAVPAHALQPWGTEGTQPGSLGRPAQLWPTSHFVLPPGLGWELSAPCLASRPWPRGFQMPKCRELADSVFFAAIFSLQQKKKKRGEGRKRAGSRGVGNSKAFLMKASAVSIQDLDLINGSYSQITLRLFSVSQRGASTYRVPFYFVS